MVAVDTRAKASVSHHDTTRHICASVECIDGLAGKVRQRDQDRSRMMAQMSVAIPAVQRSLGRQSGSHAVAQTAVVNIAIQAINITTGIVTARLLGPEGRGALAAITVWPALLAYSTTLGLPAASIYHLRQRTANRRSLVGAGILLGLLLGSLSGAVGYVLIPTVLQSQPAETVMLARMAVTLTPLALLSMILMAQGQATEEFTKYNAFRLISQSSILAALLINVAVYGRTVFGAAAAYTLGAFPALLWYLTWIWRSYRPSLQSFRQSAGLLAGYGTRAWGTDFLATATGQIDRLLVIGMLDPASMGLYVAAQSAAASLTVISTAVTPVILPKTTAMNASDRHALTGMAARTTLYAMLIAAMPLLVFGQFLMGLVYGPEFSAAGAALSLLVVASVIDGVTAVLSQAFLASGFPGTVTFIQLCGVGSALVFLFMLIPVLGLRGAGVAMLLAASVRLMLVLTLYRYQLRSRPPGLVMSRAEWSLLLRRVRSLVTPQ